MTLAIITFAGVMAACSTPEDNEHNGHNEEEEVHVDEHADEHAHMDHSSSGEVPDELAVAENPTYEVGSKALITDGHMPGMEGAEATIVGAFDTYVYAVSYDPTTGGDREINHKWVIHEELADVGAEPLEVGDEVVLEAEHMAGMQGALAEVDSVERTFVYMVDFVLTTTGEEVENHKWVTEEELSPVEEE